MWQPIMVKDWKIIRHEKYSGWGNEWDNVPAVKVQIFQNDIGDRITDWMPLEYFNQAKQSLIGVIWDLPNERVCFVDSDDRPLPMPGG